MSDDMKATRSRPVSGEPVAWRYQRKQGWGEIWRLSDMATPYFESPQDWTVEPLYAAPPAAAGREVAEELREYTAMKYMGDCKCGKCQLVPRELVERIYHTLNGTTLSPQDCRAATRLEAAHSVELDRLHKMQNEIGHCDRDKGWQGGRVSGLALAIALTRADRAPE